MKTMPTWRSVFWSVKESSTVLLKCWRSRVRKGTTAYQDTPPSRSACPPHDLSGVFFDECPWRLRKKHARRSGCRTQEPVQPQIPQIAASDLFFLPEIVRQAQSTFERTGDFTLRPCLMNGSSLLRCVKMSVATMRSTS